MHELIVLKKVKIMPLGSEVFCDSCNWKWDSILKILMNTEKQTPDLYYFLPFISDPCFYLKVEAPPFFLDSPGNVR